MDNEMGAPEKKADVNDTFAQFMGAFEVFKETNDRRLAELEQKSGADVVTTDKLARVEAALDANQRRMDELVLKSARPSLGGTQVAGASETKSAFGAFMRTGDTSRIRALEAKGLGLDDTGFLAPTEVEADVNRRLAALSPIRAIATVRTVSSSAFKKPIARGTFEAGWVAESDTGSARDETDSMIQQIGFPIKELYAMPAATNMLLDDSVIDLADWLASEVEVAFAEQETKAFVVGDGWDTNNSKQPKGFATAPTVPESAKPTDPGHWNELGHIATGVNGAFPATDKSDVLIDLVYALKSGYRQNAHFVMNRRTQAVVRKFKDADGNYLWTPPAMPGAHAGLMHFPVVEVEDMPDIANGSHSIAFGDFRRGYLIVDRQGLQILRDPYSKKPYILFYTTKRVGGGVQDFDAIKILKFSNS